MTDFYILDSEYKNDVLIEGYNSFIWTDRAKELGDFEALFPANAPILSKLVKGVFIGQTSSHKVMYLDSIDTYTNEEGILVTKISGPSAEIMLDWRSVLHTIPWVYVNNTLSSPRPDGYYNSREYCFGSLVRTNLFKNPRFRQYTETTANDKVNIPRGFNAVSNSNGTKNGPYVMDGGGMKLGSGHARIGTSGNFTVCGKTYKPGDRLYIDFDVRLQDSSMGYLEIYTYSKPHSHVEIPYDRTVTGWQHISTIVNVSTAATGMTFTWFCSGTQPDAYYEMDNLSIVKVTPTPGMDAGDYAYGGPFNGDTDAAAFEEWRVPDYFNIGSVNPTGQNGELRRSLKAMNLASHFTIMEEGLSKKETFPNLSGFDDRSPHSYIPGYAPGARSNGSAIISTKDSLLDTVLNNAKASEFNFGMFRGLNGDEEYGSITFHGWKDIDRTSGNYTMVFSQDQGNISSMSESSTSKELYTDVLVLGKETAIVVSSDNEGISKKQGILEAREIEGQKSSKNTITRLTEAGEKWLKEQNEKTVIDCEIVMNPSLVYEKDYGLGMTVLVEGYTEQKEMVISEVIITKDPDGETVYPTFQSKED